MGFMGSGKAGNVSGTASSAATSHPDTSGFPSSRLRKLAEDVKKTAKCAASVAAETANAPPGKMPLGQSLDIRNPMSTVTTMDDGSKMHMERCVMGWHHNDIYAVVADVAKYSQFLPWCVQSIVHSSNSTDVMKVTEMDATLSVGFSFLKEKYTSDVTLVPGQSIHARLQGDSTLLRELRCDWRFMPFTADPKQVAAAGKPHPVASEVDFRVSFAFRNPLHTNLTSMVMSNVVTVMTKSFEERITALHGAPSVRKYFLPVDDARAAEMTTLRARAAAQFRPITTPL